MTLEMDAGANHIKGTLFKTSLEKSLFSSPFACIKSLDERLRKLVKKYGENGFPDIAKLKELRDALQKIDADSFPDTKNFCSFYKAPSMHGMEIPMTVSLFLRSVLKQCALLQHNFVRIFI